MDILELISIVKPARWGVFKINNMEFRKCANLRKVPKEAKSVIIMSFPYYAGSFKGNLSKYAMVLDYHKVVGQLLNRAVIILNQSGYQSVGFVDNSPIYEVQTALSAGVGIKGQNGLIIDSDYGSFVFLGEIVTTKDFTPTKGAKRDCLRCGRCQRACPGEAIEDGRVDKNKCFSYITQRKTPPTKEEERLMRRYNLAWGCDICQDVCPLNKGVKQTYIEEFKKDIITLLDENTINLDNRAYTFRGIEVLKRNLKINKS